MCCTNQFYVTIVIIFLHEIPQKKRVKSYNMTFVYKLIFVWILGIILHSQKSKYTIAPGTKTTTQVEFGALFEFYETGDFQIS